MKKRITLSSLIAVLSLCLLGGCKNHNNTPNSEPEPTPTETLEPTHEVTYEEFHEAALEAEKVEPGYTFAEFVYEVMDTNLKTTELNFSYYHDNDRWHIYDGDENYYYRCVDLLNTKASDLIEFVKDPSITNDCHWYLSSTTFEARNTRTMNNGATVIEIIYHFNRYGYVVYEYQGYVLPEGYTPPTSGLLAIVGESFNITYSTDPVSLPTPTDKERDLTYEEFHEIALKYHDEYEMTDNFAIVDGCVEYDSDYSSIDVALYKPGEYTWDVYENYGSEEGASMALALVAMEAYELTDPQEYEYYASVDETGKLYFELKADPTSIASYLFNKYGFLEHFIIRQTNINIEVDIYYSKEDLPVPTPTPSLEPGEIPYWQFHDIALELKKSRPDFDFYDVNFYIFVNGEVEKGTVTYFITNGSAEYYSGSQPQLIPDDTPLVCRSHAENVSKNLPFKYYFIDETLSVTEIDSGGNTTYARFDEYGRFAYIEARSSNSSIYIEYSVNYH